MRSIRSFNRARTERGFVLIAALTLAVLYFMLMELMLVDSSRELAEARRFRSRVIASVVAENAAELAAVGMIGNTGRTIEEDDGQGSMTGELRVSASTNRFELEGRGETIGTEKQTASVFIEGEIVNGTFVRIEFARHAQ